MMIQSDDKKITVYRGDCLEVMPTLEAGSIDMVMADVPYGTTACKWDAVIPFEPMWQNLRRLAKKNAAIVMTASQPFTSALVMSNPKMFKYCWVWQKEQAHTALNAKHQPLKVHEDIAVFSRGASTHSPKGSMTYFPQMTEGKPYRSNPKKNGKHSFHGSIDTDKASQNNGVRYPVSVQRFNRDRGIHPTQKPVALMEYLIKTYTNEGDTVLDFTMGSGTTGVACKNLNRRFVGIEREEDYYEIALNRIDAA